MEIVIPRIQRREKPVARRSISIPEELCTRMRKFADVNWSAIASQAFEQVVKELEKQEEV